MDRREYIGAVAVLLGISLSGCTDVPDMTQDEAKNQFDDVQEFEEFGGYDEAVRVVDKEAGIVLYAVSNDSTHAGQGMGLTSVPLSDTDLGEND